MADLYEVALTKLKADDRPLSELARLIEIPKETLRDLKSGYVKSPRLDTLRKIVAHYTENRKKQPA